MERKGVYYDVVKYGGFGGLCITHNESVESVAADIADIEKSATAQGYPAETWLIVRVEWGRMWDENGVFLSSWENRRSVAVYDGGEVTEL